MLTSVFIPNQNNSYAWINLIFLVTFLLLGIIEPYTVLFGYFLETIIIGVFNVFKMVVASKHDGSGNSIFFSIPFFIFHYGMFVAIQSIFVFVVIGIDGTKLIKEPFNIIENYIMMLDLQGMEYMLPLLITTQLVKFLLDFMHPKKYLEFTVQEIMFKPYVRIFVQQFTVIIAMFFIIFSNVSVIAALLLILFRTIVDFSFASIRKNGKFLDYLVDKSYNGKETKEELRKKLLLISE